MLGITLTTQHSLRGATILTVLASYLLKVNGPRAMYQKFEKQRRRLTGLRSIDTLEYLLVSNSGPLVDLIEAQITTPFKFHLHKLGCGV